MANLPISPRSYRNPSPSFQPTSTSSLTIHEGTDMVKEKVPLEQENEEIIILQWLYKGKEVQQEVKYAEIYLEKYGVGYQLM